jgi:hypothetical protein
MSRKRSYRLMKKSIDVLLVVSKERGMEVIAGRTKNMVMSRDQTTGSSHNLKTDNTLIRG